MSESEQHKEVKKKEKPTKKKRKNLELDIFRVNRFNSHERDLSLKIK